MKAAILRDIKNFAIEDIPEPQPSPAEVLIQVHSVGLCMSDWGKWAGLEIGFTPPFHAGHELSGTVLAIGSSVTRVAVGDRVTGYAEERCFAEKVVLPEEWIVKIPATMPLDHALGEPIACAIAGAGYADVHLGDVVVVLGAGFMGLLLTQLLAHRGAYKVIVSDVRDSVLKVAHSLGADIVAKPSELQDIVGTVTNGQGADVVVEATGKQAALSMVGDLARYYGRVVFFGYHQGETRTVPMQQWNFKALQMINGHNRYPERFVQNMRIGIKLYEVGKLNLAPLVTHQFPLEHINEAFQAAGDKRNDLIKAIITI